MSEPITIRLPAASPSLNTFLRQHWSKRRKIKADWMQMVAASLPRGAHAEATGKRRLTVERHGVRGLDLDNLAGGLKPIIDTLRAFRLLIDDNPNALELVVRNVKLQKGEEPHTILIIEEAVPKDKTTS